MLQVKILQDEDAENPRTSMDNLGVMVCFHKRYKLGDDTELRSEDFNSWNALHGYLQDSEDAAVVLPLYLMDHSGLSMSVNDYRDRWDSGQVGYIYATRSAIRKAYSRRNVTEKLLSTVRKALIAEVETYDQYLSGDVWGYVVIDDETGETVDSCWGFYGGSSVEEAAADAMKHFSAKGAAEGCG